MNLNCLSWGLLFLRPRQAYEGTGQFYGQGKDQANDLVRFPKAPLPIGQFLGEQESTLPAEHTHLNSD